MAGDALGVLHGCCEFEFLMPGRNTETAAKCPEWMAEHAFPIPSTSLSSFIIRWLRICGETSSKFSAVQDTIKALA